MTCGHIVLDVVETKKRSFEVFDGLFIQVIFLLPKNQEKISFITKTLLEAVSHSSMS